MNLALVALLKEIDETPTVVVVRQGLAADKSVDRREKIPCRNGHITVASFVDTWSTDYRGYANTTLPGRAVSIFERAIVLEAATVV